MSLDYYIQGFCLSSLTLRPSAFYAAAGLRTNSIRDAIWRGLRTRAEINGTSSGGGGDGAPCAGAGGGGRRRGAIPPLDACQSELCGIHDCNLNQ